MSRLFFDFRHFKPRQTKGAEIKDKFRPFFWKKSLLQKIVVFGTTVFSAIL